MLLRISVIILLLGVFSAGCIEKKPERLAKRESPVTARLAAMVAEQEQARNRPDMTVSMAVELRQRHRHEVYRLMAKALITEPEDLYRAALLLQSTDESVGPEASLQAHYLAVEAAEGGWEPARFLAATTMDRYLVLSGRPQLYGTQYHTDEQGLFQLYPFDTATTDSTRAVWGVPALDSLIGRMNALNSR